MFLSLASIIIVLLFKQGKVFVHGVDSSNLGYLGLGNNIIETTKFVEILSLNKYKICQAYAGCHHSLFQTNDGLLLACGKNDFDELLLHNEPSNEKVFDPVETRVINASFCIVGNISTTVLRFVPPVSQNRTTFFEKK